MALIKIHQIDFSGSASYTGSLQGTSSYALTSSITQQVSTSISTQNLQHNVLFTDTSGPGYVQVDGGLRYNPNQDLLTTTSSYALQALTASFALNGGGTTINTGSFVTTSSFNTFTSSYSTGSFTGSFTGSSNLTSLTAASAVITGNVTVLGTASINTLIVNQTQLSTGSNQLGDNVDDFQTLYGTVRIPTGSLTVTGSTNITGSLTVIGGITGSLFGTASYTPTLNQVTTAGNITTNSIIYSGSAEAIKPSVDSVSTLGASNLRFGTVYGRAVSSVNNSLDLIGSNINLNDSSGNIKLKVFGSTGNVTIQNGGTFTDNGFRLDISGSARITTGLTVTGSILIEQNNPINFGNQINIQRTGTNILYASSIETIVNTIGTSPIRFQIGSSEVARITGSFVGIGTTTPTASLHISGSSGSALLKVDSDSNSNILFVSGSGRVGIGTNNPAVQLDLVGQYKQTSVSGVTGLYYISTANANQVRGVWDFYTNTSVSPDFFGRFGFKFEGGTADSFKQYQIHVANSTTPKMVVDGAGNVGIGTTTPISRLDILDTTIASGSANSGSVVNIAQTWNTTGNATAIKLNVTDTASGGASQLLDLQLSSTSQFKVSKFGVVTAAGSINGQSFGGTVGPFQSSGTYNIYSYAPSLTLTTGTATINGFYFAPTINQTGGANGIIRGLYITPTIVSASDYRAIETTTGSVILNGGNVGIGTITPTSLLQVKGSGTTSATTALLVQNSVATERFRIYDDGTSAFNTSQLYISSSGKISVGSTINAGYALEVYDTGIYYAGASSAAQLLITTSGSLGSKEGAFITAGTSRTIQMGITDNSVIPVGIDMFAANNAFPSSYINFRVNNTDLVRMTGSFVGIGTTTPTASLHISGSSSQTLLKVDSDVSSSILLISGSGNVGIGIPTPNYKLDISGSTFTRKLLVGSDAGFTGNVTSSDYYQRSTTSGTVFIVRDVNNNTLFAAAGGSSTGLFYSQAQNIGLGLSAPTAKVQILGNGATSATTTFLIQNSTPTTLMTVLDNGQFTYTTPTMTLAASQSAYVISPIITASNAVGGNYYGVNITPTFYQTTGSQTQTAFRVASTFSQSSAAATLGTNVIADFGATSVGSQLTVTDITSGSIYMVNDVSGLPIIEATSDWNVNIYNFPNIILQKTGSQVNINGTLKVSGSFILPLSQSVSPQTGSAYWSGSLLFVYDGTRYRSSSFA